MTTRRAVLKSLDASDAVCDEVLAYTHRAFGAGQDATYPLEDEPFVAAWREYARDAETIGAYESLRQRLVQLRFPIEEGISGRKLYIRATKRGEHVSSFGDLGVKEPEQLRLEIYPTPAGHIPLLITRHRSDFVMLVRALARRNEPDEIPDSMGACMVAGYNNWDRIRRYRSEWVREHGAVSWTEEFARLAQRKELYQDRFIILSDGYYSGVSPSTIGLPDEVWRSASLIIRREHECAHYFTRRVLGSMRNNLHDELIADYMGIVGVFGQFRADWFLQFMGLEGFPRYRPGGRFENYVDGLSDEAVRVLQTLLVTIARNLDGRGMVASADDSRTAARAQTIIALATSSLEELSFLSIG